MSPSSRTPEGVPNRCPVCRNYVSITPSEPAHDAPCPVCGTLLWFVVSDVGVFLYEKLSIVREFPQAEDDVGENAPASVSDEASLHRVRIKDGTFEGFEGDVVEVDSKNGKLKVMISVFGRMTPVDVNEDQVEAA